jgi:hypothetical protein
MIMAATPEDLAGAGARVSPNQKKPPVLIASFDRRNVRGLVETRNSA